MRQIRVHGPDDVRLDRVDPPRPGPRDAVVRVGACGICGSDLSYIHMGGLTGAPMCLGHEVAGIVDWVGDEVPGVAVGDRVIVYPTAPDGTSIGSGADEGGLTDALLVRDAAAGGRLFAVPAGMPLAHAALGEPLGIGMQAVNQADVAPGDSVAVFGCGPIGLMAVATLLYRGIHEVVAVDLSPTRRALAERLGAQAVLDPATDDVWAELARLHGTAPFRFGPTPATDAYIEASGAPSVIGDVIRHGRVDGRMAVVALHFTPVATDYLTLLMKQFTIRGSIEYPPRFEDAVELLARRDLSDLVTHRFDLDDFHAGLALLEGSKDCGKVMITMGVE
ncbi:MAG: zinc-binding dehydrogenase [Actinobacteria bacterium]|nr:zinc-binding dehydrogenase [Actinomycetota bacterium]